MIEKTYKMKNLVIIISFFLISTWSFSQNRSKALAAQIFTKAELSKVKYISELVPDSLKDCKFDVIDIVGKVGGKEITANGKVDEVIEQVRNILKRADVGTKIYIDAKYIDHKSGGDKYKSFTLSIKVTK
jgi:hypothetical protein